MAVNGGRSYILVVVIAATPVSADLSQFVARVYLRRGPFTTFFSTDEGGRGHGGGQERGSFDAATVLVMRSQDRSEDAP